MLLYMEEIRFSRKSRMRRCISTHQSEHMFGDNWVSLVRSFLASYPLSWSWTGASWESGWSLCMCRWRSIKKRNRMRTKKESTCHLRLQLSSLDQEMTRKLSQMKRTLETHESDSGEPWGASAHLTSRTSSWLSFLVSASPRISRRSYICFLSMTCGPRRSIYIWIRWKSLKPVHPPSDLEDLILLCLYARRLWSTVDTQLLVIYIVSIASMHPQEHGRGQRSSLCCFLGPTAA